jgi:hypothetical protein
MARSAARRIPFDQSREEAFRAEVEDARNARRCRSASTRWSRCSTVLAHIPYRTTRELLGVPTSFAGIDELIRMKRATGNAEKDLPDLRRLEALRKDK